MKTIGRIERTGVVLFGDARIIIREEGISDARKQGGYEGEKKWSHQFKSDVFKRVIQTLNRLGWACEIPEDYIKQYSLSFARNRRECSKGDVKGFLDLSGRCITFEMWQGVNTPTRPDHGGRYESNKEACAPYLLRLEMIRTKNKIRDYLCNVFAGYVFNDDPHDGRSAKCGTGALTAMEWLSGCYRSSWHFKGDNWDEYKKQSCMTHNIKSADGVNLEHGQRVWFFDYNGRIATGVAYYNINNMWWIISGKYGHTNQASHAIYTSLPENPRIKRNNRIQRSRLEDELSKAVKQMNFERASVLRDVLFPKKEQIYLVWHKGHKAYHRSNFSGYTTNVNDAGKFTEYELSRRLNETDEVIKIEEAA